MNGKIKGIMRKPWRRWLLIGAITAGLMAIVADFWSVKNIQVKFHTEAAKDINYQIFYASKPDKSFSEAESVKKTVKAGKHDVKITLPARKIFKFRIDPGQNPGKVVLADIRLEGRSTLNIDDGNKFIYQNHIDDKKIEGGKITLVSSRNDPYIVYKDKFELKAGREIDFCLFVISLFFALFVSTKSVNYLAKFKVLELRSRIDIVFLACFFALLFVPMSRISDDEKSEQENRMLAKFPTRQSIKTASDFSKQFEAWFNDRFLGRDDFIKIYNFMDYKINNKMENEKVFNGKENWLFYKLEHSIENYQNAILFSDIQLKKITAYLNEIQAWCEANNKKFYFVIAPDKNKIYGECYYDLPKKRPDSESKTRQLLNYLARHSKVKAIYLYDVLHAHKKGDLLYYKNDTHWNLLGAYYGYQEIMHTIRQDFSDVPEAEIQGFSVVKHETGDLTRMFAPVMQKKDFTEYKSPIINKQSKCHDADGNRRLDIVCNSPKAKLKLFMQRDSFAGGLIPYLSQSFNKSVFVWHEHMSKSKLPLIKEADVIIIETVERATAKFANMKFPKD